jgi:F-type H+-transporting ATPase subunit c
MKRNFDIGVLTTFMFMVFASIAAAAETAAPGSTAVAAGAGVDYTKTIVIVASIVVAGLTMSVGTLTTALGMGNGLVSAANAVGRNPEAQGKVLIVMMVGLAMIESLAIYALVIALVLIYANPLVKLIGL